MQSEPPHKGRPLRPEEAKLWRQFSKDIKALSHRRGLAEHHATASPESSPAKTPAAKAAAAGPPTFQPRIGLAPIPGASGAPGTGASLDRRTAAKLRRGRMPIEATLDLHGCTQREALERLQWFLLASAETGRRAVLVITGKGLKERVAEQPGRNSDQSIRGISEPGILRKRLPEWLAMAPLKSLVSGFTPAGPRHGGEGAWYITLKRPKS